MFNQHINREMIDELKRERGKNPKQAILMTQHDQVDILMLDNRFNIFETLNADN